MNTKVRKNQWKQKNLRKKWQLKASLQKGRKCHQEEMAKDSLMMRLQKIMKMINLIWMERRKRINFIQLMLLNQASTYSIWMLWRRNIAVVPIMKKSLKRILMQRCQRITCPTQRKRKSTEKLLQVNLDYLVLMIPESGKWRSRRTLKRLQLWHYSTSALISHKKESHYKSYQ